MTTTKKRILIVDDSAVMRRLVTQAIEKDTELMVCGMAGDGAAALARIEQLTPDLITLDVEMPQMDGLTTLVNLREHWPRLPVIMCSSLTACGAETTLEALAKGANDYIAKPPATGATLDGNLKAFSGELSRKIRALLRLADTSVQTVPAQAPPARIALTPTVKRTTRASISLLVIGSSTGGPNALAEVLAHLPANFPVPVVIAQHMPPVFTRLLAERLDSRCHLRVTEGVHGGQLTAGQIWLAPGDHHMRIVNDAGTPKICLDQKPPVNFCRPAVDPLLESAMDFYSDGILAVILTGMGQDGFVGCQRLYAQGGVIFAQDEASSVVWGMPGVVARGGIADRVLPLSEIGPAIVSRVGRGTQQVARYAV